MREVQLIHWVNTVGAECGAPGGAVSPYPHAVTCPACIIGLKCDLLERRAAARGLSIARASIHADGVSAPLPERPSVTLRLSRAELNPRVELSPRPDRVAS